MFRRSVFVTVVPLLLLVLLLLPNAISAQDHNEILPNLPGKIVFIGADYNVFTVNLETDERFRLSDDGSRTRRYVWPTWSFDGRLAYFCCDAQASGRLQAEIYISDAGTDAGKTVYENPSQSVIYAYWSPQTCSDGDACLDLAVLLNTSNSLEVAQIRNSRDFTISKVLGTGAPFYYSWSPNGMQMVLHRNGTQVEILDVNSQEVITTYEQSSGAFQSPAWSPIDDRVLYGARGAIGGTTDLKVVGSGVTQTLISGLEGQVYFNWSPDGNYVAYTALSSRGSGTLFVVDTITGELISQSTVPEVFAFFWSPDSTKIAYVSVATPAGSFNASNPNPHHLAALAQVEEGLAWSILDVQTGENSRYTAFFPTQEMLYLLVYFDQFAQSHSVWSPDSTHIVYSEFANPEEPQPIISIQDVTRPDTVPLAIANGVFASWSF